MDWTNNMPEHLRAFIDSLTWKQSAETIKWIADNPHRLCLAITLHAEGMLQYQRKSDTLEK